MKVMLVVNKVVTQMIRINLKLVSKRLENA